MLYPQSSLNKEPRTYRQKAYKVYLSMAKQRKSQTEGDNLLGQVEAYKGLHGHYS